MAEKRKKYFARLSKKQKERVSRVLKKLYQHDFSGIDIVKMKGIDATYRCRIGDLRLIFKIVDHDIRITHLGSRGDVYK